MKLLIFNTFYAPVASGGAEKSVQLLAEEFLAQGHEPVVVTTYHEDMVDFVNGVKVYYLKPRNFYWNLESKNKSSLIKPFWHLLDTFNFLMWKKIENVLKNEMPDVVYTNNLSGFSDIVWKIAHNNNVKIVHTIRDYYQVCYKSTMFNKTQCPKQCNSCRLHSFPKRISSNLVNNVVGISEFILNKHLELGYFKNSTKHVIYNPIIKPHFSDKQTNNDLKIGYVGTLAIHKGIELLLNEFVNLKIKASLYIYGKDQGQGYEYVLKKNYQLENVFFMGYQDINLIYSSIDLLIVPSLWSEPFGRIVPEANSFGIPVIVSNKGGLPELISDNRNGLVFDPSIPGDLVNKIKLADSLIKQNSFSFDNRKFLKEEVALHYLRVLSNEL